MAGFYAIHQRVSVQIFTGEEEKANTPVPAATAGVTPVDRTESRLVDAAKYCSLASFQQEDLSSGLLREVYLVYMQLEAQEEPGRLTDIWPFQPHQISASYRHETSVFSVPNYTCVQRERERERNVNKEV